MTLRQLEYLLAVVEERSFTRAAQRLLVSQPSLSQQIKVLERSVGGALLERQVGTVRPTELGTAFVPHAVATLESSAAAVRAARAAGRLEAGELWVGTLKSIAIGIIPTAIQVWRREHPLMDVRIHEFPNIDLLTAEMCRGGSDIGVGPEPKGWEGPRHPLGAEEFVIVLPVDEPPGGRTIDLRTLADRPWVLYAEESGLAPLVAEACGRAGFTPRAAVRTHHSATAVELAAAGLGPALVPGNVVGPDFLACTAIPDPPVRRELVAFTRARPSPPALAFIEIITEYATL